MGTYIDAQQDDLALPADHDSLLERRPRGAALAEEVFSVRSSLASREPEAALMCAVLEDAVQCFQRQFVSASRHARRLGKEAEAWLFSDNSQSAFSFLAICAALDLGPQYIRRGLRGRSERGPSSKPAPV
jgi:hypothetical protein